MDYTPLETTIEEISSFLKISKEVARKNVEFEWMNPGKTVANAWKKANPKVEKEGVEEFYKTTSSYIYDLSLEGARPTRIEWRDEILKYITQFDSKNTILDFGGGVGTESIFFKNAGFDVTYYDLPGKTLEFAQFRFSLYAPEVKTSTSIDNIEKYDSIICLEVLEHLIEPIETMKLLYEKLNKGGLLFLTESFELVSDDYPSHLPQNKKYAKNFKKILTDMGFSFLGAIANERIMVLGKFGTTDIVVPTYNAYEQTRKCIESVRQCTNSCPYRLILVNDASTDPRIKKLLKKEIEAGDLYLENKTNLGFVKTANRGISVSSTNDVVLLNTDTEVTDEWLASIQEAIYKKNNYATANPLSNNASIYSIGELSVLKNLSVREIGRIVKDSSMHLTPEIPTSVGFCMYIKRSVLKDIGILDEIFGRGYGEESDFCMRCNESGYTHILVDSSYVFHEGHASMLAAGDIKKGQLSIDAHEEILLKRYPNYLHIVSDFLSKRVMQRIKNNVIQNITTHVATNRKKILYAIHSPINGEKIGGTEFHLRDLKDQLDSNNAIYVLYIKEGEDLVLEEYVNGIRSTYLFNLPFKIEPFSITHPYMYERYKDILWTFDIDILHVQHLLNHTFDIIYAARYLGIPITMTVHDYYLISPDYNLMHRLSDGNYSGKKTPSVDYFEKELGLINFSIEDWQKQINRFLRAVNLFVFPSNTVKREICTVYDIKNWEIIGHGEDPGNTSKNILSKYTRAKKNKFSVLFLGYSHAAQKGKHYIERMLDILLSNNIEVHMLGTSPEYWPKYNDQKNFICHGLYHRDDVVNILTHIGPSLIALPSPWPETFSYTYSEALSSHVPVIAFNIGAVSERSKTYGATVLIKDISGDAMAKKIISLSKDTEEYSKLKEQAGQVVLKTLDDNRREYEKLYESIYPQSLKKIAPSLNTLSGVKQAASILSEFVEERDTMIGQLIQDFDLERQENRRRQDMLKLKINRLQQFMDRIHGMLAYRVYKKSKKILRRNKLYIQNLKIGK